MGGLFLCRFQAPVDEESEQLQDLRDDSTNDEAQARYGSSSRLGGRTAHSRDSVTGDRPRIPFPSGPLYGLSGASICKIRVREVCNLTGTRG